MKKILFYIGLAAGMALFGLLAAASLKWAVAALAGFIVSLVILRDFRYGLYLFIFFLPFGVLSDAGGLKITYYEAILALTTASYLIDALSRRAPMMPKNFYTPFLAGFIALLSFNLIFVTDYRFKTLFYVVHFIEALVAYIITLGLLRRDPNEGKRLFLAIIVMGVFQATLGILQHLTGGFGATFQSNRGYLGILGLASGHVWHARGTFIAFNIYAAFLTVPLCLLLPRILSREKGWVRVCFAILAAGFIFSYSRGALSGMIGASLVLLYLKLPKKWFVMALILLAAGGAGMTVKATSGAYIKTVSYDDRQEIWKRPWQLITGDAKTFLIGTGANTYPYVVRIPASVEKFNRDQWFAHNEHLLHWQEFGLVGFLFIIAFMLTVFGRNFRRAASKDPWNIRAAMAALAICTLVHGYVDHNWLTHARNLYFVMLALSEAHDQSA